MRVPRNFKPLLIAAEFLLLFFWICSAVSAEVQKAKEVPEEVVMELQALFRRYYPHVAVTNRGVNGLHFEYEVRAFEFHDSGKGKRESSVRRGPKEGGVLCSIYYQPGTYQGQVGLGPRLNGQPEQIVYDRKWFKELLMAPYSKKRDSHLWVALAYPDDANVDFLAKFRQIMVDFEQSSDRK